MDKSRLGGGDPPRYPFVLMFRFVHTADWQLGKPFGGFRPETVENLKRARLDAIGRIAKVARDHDAPHVVVAGDVWDTDLPSDRTVRQPLDAMGQARDVTWWLLPGNHDPASRGGLWDRLRAGGLPANVRCLCSAEPHEAAPGVYFLPAPLVSKNPGHDPTAAMDAMTTPEGALRIGVGHGGVSGFGDESKAVIGRDRPERAGLAYLALGDWHGHGRVTDRVWYAGTPEPDSFPSNEPGYVLLVQAGAGRAPSVTPVPTWTYHWSREALDLTKGRDPVGLFEARFADGPPRADRLVRLKVTGATGLHERTALAAHLDRQHEDSFAHLRWDMDGLGAAMDDEALDALDREGSLRACADALLGRERAEGASERERLVARRALELMASFAG